MSKGPQPLLPLRQKGLPLLLPLHQKGLLLLLPPQSMILLLLLIPLPQQKGCLPLHNLCSWWRC